MNTPGPTPSEDRDVSELSVQDIDVRLKAIYKTSFKTKEPPDEATIFALGDRYRELTGNHHPVYAWYVREFILECPSSGKSMEFSPDQIIENVALALERSRKPVLDPKFGFSGDIL